MKLLLVDIGNTRVKWATSERGVLAPQQAAEHAGWTAADWLCRLFDRADVGRVVAASVAGDESRRALVAAAATRGVTDVQFVATTAQACGVRNAYPVPGLLGVDRWLAVIGAHHLYRSRACCIVDVGTAATIDTVLADGRHLGGYIVPGPQLMVRSLLTGTSDLTAHTAASRTGEHGPFADNTRDAIEQGCRVALGALIDRACAELGQLTPGPPVLVVTGGAAAEVLQYVKTGVEQVPDLVLRGIAQLAAAGP